MEQLLITQDDLRRFRPTAEFNEARIVPYILEAQELDIKPLLNEVLYYDLIQNMNEPKYKLLVYGGEYTYRDKTYSFNGLVASLSYFTLARFIQSNPLNITSFGVVVKTTTQSQPADSAAIRAEVNSLKSSAMGYQREVERFLERHPNDYPLYADNGKSSKSSRNQGFKFFKA